MGSKNHELDYDLNRIPFSFLFVIEKNIILTHDSS
jgi:hypothetical protein